jgi:hypothetical protein
MALRLKPATARCASRAPCALPARSRRALRCQASFEVLGALAEAAAAAAPGSVAAPPGTLLGAVVVVTIVGTAIIPLALKPGERVARSRAPCRRVDLLFPAPPHALSPPSAPAAAGQEAADTIFDAQGKKINRVTVKGPGPGAMTKKGGKK